MHKNVSTRPELHKTRTYFSYYSLYLFYSNIVFRRPITRKKTDLTRVNITI